jgi:hypothetical protein
LDYDDLRIVDSLDQSGFFASKNTYPGPGGCRADRVPQISGARAARMASALFPQAAPSGAPVDPVLPATAAAFGEWAIDLDHAVVIRTVLAREAARRLEPDVWAAAERQLTLWAREYGADVWARWVAS